MVINKKIYTCLLYSYILQKQIFMKSLAYNGHSTSDFLSIQLCKQNRHSVGTSFTMLTFSWAKSV